MKKGNQKIIYLLIKVYSSEVLFIVRFVLILGFIFTLVSCKKYLDKRPSKQSVIPSTLNDMQALLDNTRDMNQSSPDLLEGLAGNTYIETTTWQHYISSIPDEALNYIWDKDAISNISWNAYTSTIYNSNLVLDLLPAISKETNQTIWNNVKGAALFFRAFAFQRLAQLYCRPYSASATTDLGIPLRLTSNVGERSVRSTVKETYDQIIGDLKQAIDLLPEVTSFSTRPNKAAAYGALARNYLCMGEYMMAGRYADSALMRTNTLIDYNTLIPVNNPPIPPFNPEIIFFHSGTGSTFLSQNLGIIDTSLYKSYDENDLRKILFFISISGGYGFRGSYCSSNSFVYRVFDGIATDEMYLIRAECYARAGNINASMSDLNSLMLKRWKSGSWIPVNSTIGVNDALSKILSERRKELIYRGLYWEDLRRLNLAGANISLTRIINGVSYNLPPNDLRWVMLIPWDVINRSGMQQNPR